MSSATEDLLAARFRGAAGSLDAAALDNFAKVFAIGPEDRVALLLDNEIDPRVPAFIWRFARGRGAEVLRVDLQLTGQRDPSMNSASKTFPDMCRPIVEWATFVVTSWFGATGHRFFRQLRREQGQRWVKISYFRDLDVLGSEAAAFPLDVISLLLRKTAARYPTSGSAHLRVSDPRGSDLSVEIPEENIHESVLRTSRWRGEVTAERPGCYIHYLPTHGPNLYNLGARGESDGANGVLVPQWGVGFEEPFAPAPEIVFEHNLVTKVNGAATERELLESMIVGCNLVELGSGFNPKWPRDQIYPGGSNSPGALHFGLDLPAAPEYIRVTLPKWVEPPVHVDLVSLDATVTINGEPVIEDGRLVALDDPEVVALASRYGDPAELLSNWPAIDPEHRRLWR